MPATTDDILGKGWSYPPTFNKTFKEVEMASEVAEIEQSLEILLSTRPGEQLMEPNFGCNLDILVFEPINASLITYVKELIQDAILYFEPRIEINLVDINTSQSLEGVLLIELDYTIRSYNSRFNFVYPFYLEEGVNP